MMNLIEAKATFAGLNIKGGKTVMQFELFASESGKLPELAGVAGHSVLLSIEPMQTALDFGDED